jgi:DNA-directed RNA polymerase subunit M/transcription elongation factor TFIIS
MTSKLCLLSHKKENKKLIKCHLAAFSETEKLDKIYEMAFQLQDGNHLQNTFKSLKESKLGLSHPDFSVIAKKMEETDLFMNKNFETVEGVNECSKCKSKRTISFTKQVRSADEGASVFITCIDCKHRFILNS